MRCSVVVAFAALAGAASAAAVEPRQFIPNTGSSAAPPSSSSSSSSSVPAVSSTPVAATPTTSTPSTTTAADIAPSPTNSGACTLHIDHWHCDGEAHSDEDGHTDEEHAAESEAAEVISDTGGEGCVQHGTHFHCPAGVEASCSSALDDDDYNLPLHIGALFVLLVASAIGVFTPVTVGGWTNGRKMRDVFFILKHFGTGVIIATAFIHLLMHAFVMFANECLGELAYEATAPAIAMASMLLVFLIDFFGARWMSRTTRGAAAAASPSTSVTEETKGGHAGHDHDFSKIDTGVFATGEDKRAHWEVQLLEAGIIFHSIMIGVTLGAQGGSGFIPTFCAIVFHQLFEGFGLGARIATLKYPNGGSWKRWVMCSVYAVITSLGIGIGIGVRQTFNLNGRATLLTIGVLDSISAGILLYAGIAQLLVGEWLAGEMRTTSTKKVVLGLASMGAGLFAMSLIGKWA